MQDPASAAASPPIDELNRRALAVADDLIAHALERRVAMRDLPAGGRLVDCGVRARGGYRAGIDLARTCLADLADVAIVPGAVGDQPCPYVQVITDHPVAACLASQYAGWQIAAGKFFAMGSGPMRAAAGKEPLFAEVGYRERPEAVVGVLECRKEPTDEVVALIAEACGVPRQAVTLLFAPTASLAGCVQIVARSVETALHKLAELKFDLSRIVSAHGVAPLPPVAKDDLAAIGRTNDAILYGARVILHVTGDDATLDEIGPRVPSTSSPEHGAPFAEIFARFNHDFYAVDPMLFSPAVVVFQNVETGRARAFGRVEPAVMTRSFYS
jgi:methenyltetrahydromethanopterin cyclohydrolase